MEAAAIAPAAATLRFNRRHRSLLFLGHHSGRRTTAKSTTLLSRPSLLCLEAANVNVLPVSTPFCCLQRHPLLLFTRHPRSTSHSHRVNCIDHSPTKYVNDDTMHIQSHMETQLGSPVARPGPSGAQEVSFDGKVSPARPKRFQNRFLNFARLGSVVSDAAEAFFKSEIRRRLFITAVLILVSRIGYFIPLPGFDRRLIPDNYLSFAAGSVDELGDFTSELKLSLFQLGISPQIAASIIMQVLCHIVPSLVKLRKEGLDGHEKIKSYIWWISLGFAVVEAVIVSCYSLQYSVYAASHRFKHVMVTSFFLVLGAMSMTWICDTISESGFGQGSSLIICAGILTGYTDTLHKMLSQFSGHAVSWWPYVLAVLGIFTVVTMWAVLVTEGCRKIKLQYYAFKLASSSRTGGSPVTEVEPYIPFNINPTGMQPVLTTTYLLAFPSIMASIFASSFWENLKEILNPGTSSGAKPWVFYTIYAFFVFLFNIFDIANLPKEIADYMTKMGARIPNIKPGKLTIEYLTKIQASTRFWGGLLLSILATSSTLLDHYLRRINEGFALGFTSVLIIVSPIEYGHVLLIPKVLECLPQRIDSESLMLALHFAVEAGSPYFRLANGKSEKLASGLLNPFIAHQIAKGGHSITLEPDLSTDAFRFTKGTVESDL